MFKLFWGKATYCCNRGRKFRVDGTARLKERYENTTTRYKSTSSDSLIIPPLSPPPSSPLSNYLFILLIIIIWAHLKVWREGRNWERERERVENEMIGTEVHIGGVYQVQLSSHLQRWVDYKFLCLLRFRFSLIYESLFLFIIYCSVPIIFKVLCEGTGRRWHLVVLTCSRNIVVVLTCSNWSVTVFLQIQ